MSLHGIRRLAALAASAVLLLSSCAPEQNTPVTQPDGDALTWASWYGYDNFLSLAARTYPDIRLEPTAFAGANRTGYSWAQMRGDDIPDIFITSQILDEELAKERLVDLSSYDFVSNFFHRAAGPGGY